MKVINCSDIVQNVPNPSHCSDPNALCPDCARQALGGTNNQEPTRPAGRVANMDTGFDWDGAYSRETSKPKEKPATNRNSNTPEPIPDFNWDFSSK